MTGSRKRPPDAAEDYTKVSVLLPFVRNFVEAKSSYKVSALKLDRDGSLVFRLQGERGQEFEVGWVETPTGKGIEISRNDIVVRPWNRIRIPAELTGPWEDACRHVAERLARLQRGTPPHLLQWRNRNPQRIQWSARLFSNLCPDLLVKDKTAYFNYTVSAIDEFEGFLNVEFQSRQNCVRLRLMLGESGSHQVIRQWGPISLVVMEDDRTLEQRESPEHQVEEFLGYILSRNLPPRFTLEFERGDPPAGFLPPDLNIDFLRRTRLDDTGFFEMLFSTSRDIAVVTSCDRECFNLFSFVSGRRETWTTHSPWQVQPACDLFFHYHNINLTSRSGIMGEEELERCLESIRNADPSPRLVIFFDSCLSKLIGEDVTGAIERFREQSPIPLVFYDIRLSQFPYLGQLRDFFGDLFRQAVAQSQVAEHGSVFCLGLPPVLRKEIDENLGQLGIRNLGSVFPGLDLDEFMQIGKSSVLVANSWEFVRVMFTNLFDLLDKPLERLPLPYGIAGTRRWFGSVSRAVHGEGAPGPDSLAADRDAAEAFDRETGGLAGSRIGLFTRAFGVSHQLSDGLRFGVPLLALLRELGLGLDLNLFVDPEQDPDPDALRMQLGLESGRGDSISFFDDFRQLPELLRKGDYPLVYTETFRDQRITSSGKTPLTLDHLSPGYRGAVRTARTVRALKDATFFRRYHLFLEKPFSHYREQPGGRP